MKKRTPEPSLLSAARTNPGYHWALETLIFFAVFFVIAIPETLTQMLAARLIPQTSESEQLIRLFTGGFLTVGVLIFCRCLQNRPPKTLGFRKSHAAVEYLIGILVGVLLIGASVALCLATGSLSFTQQSFSVGKWVLFLFGYVIFHFSKKKMLLYI